MLSGPNAAPRKPTRPSLGKEAIAFLYWLVLRTAPEFYRMVAKKQINKLLHSVNTEFTLK